jgi:SAM-dependent methyltransferase
MTFVLRETSAVEAAGGLATTFPTGVLEPIDEAHIAAFWEQHPCGEHQVDGLVDPHAGNYARFHAAYDQLRRDNENHIADCIRALDVAGKRVLEIGPGQGAEAEQLIRQGALWSGVDLTAASIARVRGRLEQRGLPYQEIRRGSALALPFPDNSFDIVFSHGVLHHIPQIKDAQAEIARVLKPDGQLIIMVYARWSVNYLLSIFVLRRLGLAVMYALGLRGNGIYTAHLANARQMGLLRYLRMSNFIHRNTDGPHNPYAKVYDLAELRRDFTNFDVARSYKRWMHAPPLPVERLPLGHLLGWHLWAHLRPRKVDALR